MRSPKTEPSAGAVVEELTRHRGPVHHDGPIEAFFPEPRDGRRGPCGADLRRHHVQEGPRGHAAQADRPGRRIDQ